MAIDAFTTLSPLFQAEKPGILTHGARATILPSTANVVPTATPDIDISNRAAAAYTGPVTPKLGSEPMHDEVESYGFYERFEEEEEETEEFDEFDEFFDEEYGEDWEDEMEEVDFLIIKKQQGVFVDMLM